MKKMRINRRGFTLVEIIIVVGIVVILSSAAFLGVAVTIDRANNAQNKLRREGGANFEHEAWIKVNSINLGAADFYELQTHTPEGNTPTPADDTTDDGGDGEEGGSGSEGHHTQSSSEMLKDFLDYYGISYTQNGDSITWNNPNDTYGGMNFTDAWNQWKTDHKNATGGSTSTSGNEGTTNNSGGSTHNSGNGSTTTNVVTGSSGTTNNFNTSSGTHWDGSVDRGYDQWGNHMMGAHVPDVTSTGSISFGSTNVSSFTISVPGNVLYYQCTDWRYTIKDNGNGTYTFTYTANQYKDNPPISSVSMTFKVEGEEEADITVTSYTPYVPDEG